MNAPIPSGQPTGWGSGPFNGVYSAMNNWDANHGAISYGHIGAGPIYGKF